MSDLFDDEQTLEQEINSIKKLLEKKKDTNIIIPDYILKNIKYDLYEWQEEAFKNLLIYNSNYRKENTPTHLMFNMATGSGKTLLMVSLILYYYKQGYKHFLFFVNQNNIVDKTKNNFLDYTHKKYLFNKNIIIDDKQIEIKEVDIFSDNPNSIEIKFTSIQKLHNNIREVKENINTLEDLSKIGSYYDNSKGIVMLADEGHHFNSLTKKISNDLFDGDFELAEKTTQELIEAAWEYTVVNLLLQKEKFQYKNNNVLLEFTATVPENNNVLEKYKNKIIYKFPLLNFMRKGYTKEINLVSTQQNKKERILFALLFNWYRHKIAIRNQIPNFKPVILFRSKTIEESKSDYIFFIDMINKLNKNDFKFIDDLNNKINVNTTKSYYDDITTKTEILIRFINDLKIDYQEIIDFIKINFEDKNIIITNSGTNKNKNKEVTDSEIDTLLNNLEDKNNIIRGIFTVNRLTEGWDVLNLFDIVRLPEGQNSGGGADKKTAKATVEEAQLIGRGVRYYPFKYNNKNIYKRKFDDDLNNELRMLEELNYYTYDKDSRYITDLKNELKKTGLIDSNKEKREFYIKDNIKSTPFYNNTKIFYNNQKENPNRIKHNFENAIKECSSFQYTIPSRNVNESEIEKNYDNKLETSYYKDSRKISCYIKDYPKNIFYKAFHNKANKDSSLFSFSKLKKEVAIKSIKDLLGDNFLGKCKIEFISKDVNKFEDISNEHKLKALSIFLDKLFDIVENSIKARSTE